MKFIKKIFMLLIIGSLLVMSMGILRRVHQEPLIPEEVEAMVHIPYKIDHIPVSNKRPGTKRMIRSIVVHNTANPHSSAQNERDYLINSTNSSSTSFHIVVDDKEIIEAIPVIEPAFHAGRSEGNQFGIGIEICESGDYKQAEENAIRLIAYLMKAYDIPLSEVKTHQDYSGKDCPRLILDYWDSFLERVDKVYNSL